MPSRPTKEGCTVYTIRDLNDKTYARMKAQAQRRGLTVKTWLLLALERVLDQQEKEAP